MPLEALLALPWAQHPLRPASVHCTEDPAFLRICWVIGTCGSGFRSWQPCCPSSVCIIIAKTGPFSRLVRGGASLCFVALGRGCCFSRSYLFCSSGGPFPPPRLLLCTSHSAWPPHPEFGKPTFAIFVFTLGWTLRFTSRFICKSLGLFSFLSLFEEVVAAFLS